MVTIDLRALNVDADTLSICAAGDDVVIWELTHLDFMCFYAGGTCGGGGRIIKLPKAQIPGLTAFLDKAVATVRAIEGTSCILNIEIDVSEREFFGAQEAGWPPVPLPF